MTKDDDNIPETAPLVDTPDKNDPAEKQKSRMLLISFLALVVIGLGNKIFQKLQTIPMYNYPYFLNLLTTFVYIPLGFAYVLPMIKWGNQITPEQRAIPQYKFAIMGALDGVAGIMQSFAVNYIPSGALIILLTQAAIPISMVITKLFKLAQYKIWNYIGAVIVVAGLVVVLVPQFIGGSIASKTESTGIIAVWCAVMILSCIPMTLSSVYKEKALGEVDVDVVYLNTWVSVYQFILCILLAIPSAYATNLTVKELPQNIWDGMRCYAGINSITQSHIVNGQTIPVDNCHQAPLFVTLYIAFNVGYNILIIMMLKYGGANMLWLALTFMVPLGNFAFAIPGIPGQVHLRATDYIGLFVILGGLVCYRFFGMLLKSTQVISKKNLILFNNKCCQQTSSI